ncbi:hypothetical protein OEZ85_006512 [Tetradesmus obliquus]|uniref:PWWP domain-containing protein n=1 Tax=Tetradesmus obliquus TaxID=3088 RepID=A0ABY8TUV2_TETOB|nr:hypothetical protein OEZ85_006512 [Tetradesmus obliquus]
MGKPGPRKTRGVVGIEESSEDDDKPVAQTMRPRQSHDGGDAAADRAPKRQRTASEDGARHARGAAAAEPTADDQQAHPAAETVAAAAAAAAADAMEVEAQEQQQQHEAETAAHPQQHNSKEPDTPFAAAMESAFPALPHAHSSGHGAAGADDAAAAAGSGRQRHSSRQHKAVQQQLQPERTVSRSLSSMPSYKLPNRTPFLSKMRPERKEKARMPWHGADDHWGDGFPGMSDQLPPGAEALAEPPLQEASVGWGIWLFYNKEDDAPAGEQQEEGEQQEQDEQQQEQQQQESEAEEAEQPQEPTPGTWWRGMVWWFSQKEAKYKLVFEDGEYDPNLRDGTELVKQGLALQKQALQELPAGLTSEQVSRFAREVKTALSVGEDKTGAQLLTTVKHLAEDHWGLLPGSHEVHGGAEQLYQQMLQKRKPPGTPSKAAAAAVKQEGEWAAAAAAGGSSASLQDLAAAGAGGGLGKRGRDGSIKQEHAAAAAAEQPSPSYQQDADEEPGAAAGVDGGGKGTWDLAHFQSLVPVRCLDDPLRDTAVALLSAVLQPPAAASPFALAHELEAKLHDQHGMIGPGKHMYLRHLYMIWCVLGGRELAAAAEAAQRARAAAAEGGDEDAAAAAAAAADKAAAAARAELEGVPGVADAAAVRAALLEGAASVEELFEMTRTQLGFDQQRDK